MKANDLVSVAGVKSMRDTCLGPLLTFDHIETATFVGLHTPFGGVFNSAYAGDVARQKTD
jgi:hypothetical protein